MNWFIRLLRLMMGAPQLIAAFLRQANAQGSRSTGLQPVTWLLVVCGSGTLIAIYIKAPTWVVALLASMLMAAFLLFVVSYAYCLFSNNKELRDLLRSEKWSIQKMAIEKGFIGDSLGGVFKVESDEGSESTPSGEIGS